MAHQWEYKTISLYLGDANPEGSNLTDFLEEVTLAGQEGWEAVGPMVPIVGREHFPSTHDTNFPMLLFKRPLS